MALLKQHRPDKGIAMQKKPGRSGRARTARLKPTRHPLDPRGSAAYRHASASAVACAEDPERLKKLVQDAAWKTKNAPREQFKETWPYLMAMIRILRAYYQGEYRNVPRQHLVTILGAVIYFVSSSDFIPDWLSDAGYLDDAFVVGAALESVKDDLDAFMRWEAQQI
jgi:uncharacterized membrane protein YkvA (DUF1232 family)